MRSRRQACQGRIVVIRAACQECGLELSQTICTYTEHPGGVVLSISCDEHVGLRREAVMEYVATLLDMQTQLSRFI